jgi:hypothetical protein
MEILADT